MNKVIPFKKDIVFKSNLSKITSISLEHNLQVTDDNSIVGEFVISGEYKLADTSVNSEEFLFNVPFEVSMDDRYVLDKAVIDIDDFYYEIVNNSVLSINIDVLIDRLEEKPMVENEIIDEIEEEKEELELVRENEEKIIISSEINDSNEMDELKKDETSRSLFESFDSSTETYTTYKVYIIREGDTIESLLQNYNISKEELERYNDLNEVSIGDKIIIPAINETI